MFYDPITLKSAGLDKYPYKLTGAASLDDIAEDGAIFLGCDVLRIPSQRQEAIELMFRLKSGVNLDVIINSDNYRVMSRELPSSFVARIEPREPKALKPTLVIN